MPTVSVIIPTYNSAHFVGEAVESVLKQTFQDFEIIVIDDGSKDNTEEVVKTLGPRARYVKQDNAGVSAARNHGIGLSSGKYIALLDSDDLWIPEKLERQIQILEENSEVGLVCSDWETIGIDGSLQRSYLSNCRHARSGYVFNEVIQEYFILTSTALIRRTCLFEAGLFDETLRTSNDRDLWLRICFRAQIRVLPDCLVTKRNWPGNITSQSGKSLPYQVRVFEKALCTLPNLQPRSRYLLRRQLSQCSCALGYYLFSREDPLRAREHFRKSVAWDWKNVKALAYLAASYMPARLIRALRKAKQLILRTSG